MTSKPYTTGCVGFSVSSRSKVKDAAFKFVEWYLEYYGNRTPKVQQLPMRSKSMRKSIMLDPEVNTNPSNSRRRAVLRIADEGGGHRPQPVLFAGFFRKYRTDVHGRISRRRDEFRRVLGRSGLRNQQARPTGAAGGELSCARLLETNRQNGGAGLRRRI